MPPPQVAAFFYLPSQHILQTIRAEHTFKSISWSFQISTSITINEPLGLGHGHLIFSNVIEFQEMFPQVVAFLNEIIFVSM